MRRLKSATDLLDAMRADLGPIAAAEVRSIASEREDLRAEVARLREENRDLAQRLEHARVPNCRPRRQQQRAALKRRDELATARGDAVRASEERQAAELRFKELQDQIQELSRAQASRDSEHEATLAAERFAQQRARRGSRALRANAEETAKVAEQLISASLNSSDGRHPAAFELEAVRLQAMELKSKLDEANGLYRVMAETLDGFGIQVPMLSPEDQAFDCLDEPEMNGRGQSHVMPSGVRSELFDGAEWNRRECAS